MTIFVSVFFISQWIKGVDTAWFFANQALWSLFIIITILSIQSTSITRIISLFELLHIGLNFAACYQYVTDSRGMAYLYYEYIQNVLNAIEAAILIYGVPWSGVYRGVSRIFSALLYRLAGLVRYFQGDQQL